MGKKQMIWTKQSKSHWKGADLTHIKDDDADLDSVAILHPDHQVEIKATLCNSYVLKTWGNKLLLLPDHPLALVIVEGVKSSGVSVHMPAATVVGCSVTVVPRQMFCMLQTKIQHST